MAFPALLAAVAPAIPLAQSIGRWGNWWNQELFGRATDLPWALEISDENLPAGYTPGTTFHPTFLYESLWNLALCVVLLQIERRWALRPGRLFAFYLVGYFAGRVWIEGLRIDPAHVIGPLRLNQWVSIAVVVAAVAYLVVDRRRFRATRRETSEESPATLRRSDRTSFLRRRTTPRPGQLVFRTGAFRANALRGTSSSPP